MTIDAAEIARLRDAAEEPNRFMAPTVLVLLDELEKARAERDAARTLLRDCLPCAEGWPSLRARISQLLGDA